MIASNCINVKVIFSLETAFIFFLLIMARYTRLLQHAEEEVLQGYFYAAKYVFFINFFLSY